MKKNGKSKPLKSLSDIVLEELKGLASTGKQLTSAALSSRLSARSEIQSLLQTAAGTADSPPATAEIDALRTQVETSRNQREKLLRQVADLEESQVTFTDAYNRALLFFIEQVRTGDDVELGNLLARLKQGIKKGIDITTLESTVRKVKDFTLREAVAGAGAHHTDPIRSALSRLKETYRAILDELKLNLDTVALKKLADIETRLRRADRLETFTPIRADIISLIHEYISRVSGEREEAAAFIREIGERLMEVENHILESIPYAQETLQENSEFSILLERQIGELKETVDFSTSLAELKRTVVSSLSTIQQAILRKREKDETRMAAVERELAQVREKFAAMRAEVVSARERAHSLEQEVLIDPLTGVYNRRAYERRIQEELQRFIRHGRAFSVLLLDVDRFKSINDQYGHSVGDICLKEIMKRLRPLLRESDLLARFGGEEFVVLLPETARKGAVEVAEKLRKCVEKTEFLHKGKNVGITISVGVTQVEAGDQKPEMLFQRVDQAMYRAKEQGRNCVVDA